MVSHPDPQKLPCAICGKTRQQRKDDGYDFDDKEDVMEQASLYWHGTVVCPVCEDVISTLAGRMLDDDEFMQELIRDNLKKILERT